MLKNIIRCFLAFCFVSCLIFGCTTSIGRRIDKSVLAEIKKGVSTKEDVIELMGNPNDETEDEDGSSTYFYQFTKKTEGIYGLGAGLEQQEATIRFNKKGIVTSVKKKFYDSGGTGMGGGVKGAEAGK